MSTITTAQFATFNIKGTLIPQDITVYVYENIILRQNM